MADEQQRTPEFKPEDEIDELFSRANLNPSRVGCPPRDVLIALARKQRPITDPAYEHLAKCSACYREFRGFQQSFSGPSWSTRWWLVAAALLIIAVGGSLWFAFGPRASPIARPRVPTRGEEPLPEQTVQVDLRQYSVTRNEQQKHDIGPVVLMRGRLDATILLPVGSEPGDYEVQLLDSNLRSRASSLGHAEIREFVTTLRAMLDLGSLDPGMYQLALRHQGEDWRMFPAEVK
jgi:hypothetical protein